MKSLITPCLWFDHRAEEAARFYTSIFKDGKMGTIVRNTPNSALSEGSVLTVSFSLAGQDFIALNGGPIFHFTPANSFYVGCESAEELDAIWDKLADSGSPLMERDKYPFSERFGWIEDKYGLSWQLGVCGLPQYITPFLMFVGNQHKKADEAIHFYCSVFAPSSTIHVIETQESNGFGGLGTMVVHAQFTLLGQKFMAMDNGFEHRFTFSEAMSFYVHCKTQAEIDHYWKMLTIGGETQPCGWVRDRYGVSWQIVPEQMEKWMSNEYPDRAKRVTEAIRPMWKLEMEVLRKAYEGL